jgi:putative phage-type endonuclease
MVDYVDLNPTAVSEPDFEETLMDEVSELFYAQMEEHGGVFYDEDDIEEDIDELLDFAFQIFITTFYPGRSESQPVTKSERETDEKRQKTADQIAILRNTPQPVQRTPEWYAFRHNLITASNAYKAFESNSAMNQLIYEKCQPIKQEDPQDTPQEVKITNTNTPLHWGQKYEPLTVMLYEEKYGAQVEDFGCIRHPKYPFLGASPDGIITDESSDRYGRMLEIKNVVSRDITGIPKKEYWVQMQLQMEVCDLDDCDFIETKFVEYPDRQSYEADRPDQATQAEDETLAANGKRKGVILHFHTCDGRPFYAYKPLHLRRKQEIAEWEDEMLSLYQSEKYNYTYLKYIYWKLEVLSCVLVVRNREWFRNNIPQLERVWKIIEEERVTGYEHRAPIRKQPREKSGGGYNNVLQQQQESQGCLLTFKKIVKLGCET